MKIFIGLLVFALLVAFYVVWGRSWLKAQPWAQSFFAWIEPIEIALWSKSETILFARAKQLTGILLAVLTSAGAIDITPLMPFVPDEWQGFVRAVFNLMPLALTAVGFVDEKLRRDTTKPLALVAIAEADITPAVAEKLAVAEEAKVEAVAEVKVAEEIKAEAAKV